MKLKFSRSELKAFRETTEVLDLHPRRYYDWILINNRVDVYHNAERDLVLKRASFIMNPWTPLKVRVPTIQLNNDWVVQPYVVKKNVKLAMELIIKKLGGKSVGYDIHRYNVGWWNNKPVMLDW